MILVHCDKGQEVIGNEYFEVEITVKKHTKDSVNVQAYPTITKIYCPECIQPILQSLGGDPEEWVEKLTKRKPEPKGKTK